MRYLSALLAALITLHQPSGPVFVNGDEIMTIRRPRQNEAPPEFKSAVTVHDATIYVLEPPVEVKRLRDGE